MNRCSNLGISEAKAREVSACFDEFSENKGYLDKDDLKVAVSALMGLRPSKYDVQQMLGLAETEDPACPGISKQIFLRVMARRLAHVDAMEEVRQMFRAFDRGCRGFITRDDMQQVISEAFSESEVAPAKIAEMFAEADWDGSGRIGYQQFESMVMNRLPADLLRRRQLRQSSFMH